MQSGAATGETAREYGPTNNELTFRVKSGNTPYRKLFYFTARDQYPSGVPDTVIHAIISPEPKREAPLCLRSLPGGLWFVGVFGGLKVWTGQSELQRVTLYRSKQVFACEAFGEVLRIGLFRKGYSELHLESMVGQHVLSKP